jgi:hypothetical protein
MTSQLPFDLLCEVASHLQGDSGTLFNCALVSRQWQSAFELILYQSIYIMPYYQPPPGGLSAEGFCSLISTLSGKARLDLIREISMFFTLPADHDGHDHDRDRDNNFSGNLEASGEDQQVGRKPWTMLFR